MSIIATASRRLLWYAEAHAQRLLVIQSPRVKLDTRLYLVTILGMLGAILHFPPHAIFSFIGLKHKSDVTFAFRVLEVSEMFDLSVTRSRISLEGRFICLCLDQE
jgi:hypothetical protein